MLIILDCFTSIFRTSEIEAGLALTEDEIHPIAENIETSDFQNTID